MMTRTLWLNLIMLAAAGWLLAACAGGAAVEGDKFAWRLEGGALSNYGGTDGEDSAARNTLRLLLTGRQYDFTPVDNHTVEPGAARTYRASADSSFADADGTQNQIGDAMTVQFALTSTNVAITNATLTGAFSKADAEDTYADAGQSCAMTWTLSYELDGEPVELTAEQALTGVNYILD